LDSLKEAQATLSAAVPDLDLSVTTTPSGQHIAFKPKEGTSLTPLSFKFSFDSSEESEQLRRAFNHFHEEGGSLAIPDTAINLGPSEVVADNGLLRIERTDPPSDEAPYGVKHVRLEPVEDSLIYVNYPRFSGVECIPSGS
jgi:hypothetical protein